MRMKSAILINPGLLEVNSKSDIPEPGPGEVVVKVKAALTCGTDLKAYLRGHPKIPLPSPLGHEFAGDIHLLADDVRGFSVGEPVMAVHSAPCGECSFCTRGLENLCKSLMDEKVLGAYAQYIKLPARIVKQNLYKKPDNLSYQEAAMLEPLACVVHGLNVLKDIHYETVLIIGAGPVGLLFLMLLKMRGKRVIVAGRGELRLNMAKELGADAVMDASLDTMAWSTMEATDGLGVDLVIEATGKREVWEATPGLVRPGGTVLLFGGTAPGESVCFDPARLHYDEIKLYGAFHFTPADVREAYVLLSGGRLDVKKLITGEYPLDRLMESFDELIAGRGIKFAIIP